MLIPRNHRFYALPFRVALAFLVSALLHASSLKACPPEGSNPGAPFTLYLQFDGIVVDGAEIGVRDQTGEIPIDIIFDAYPGIIDRDLEIDEICARVAEDFAPFAVNVTPSVPPELELNKSAVLVAIGGTQAQMGKELRMKKNDTGEREGTSDLGKSISFVPREYQGQSMTPKHIAQAASHEAAHQFSYDHGAALGSFVWYITHRGAPAADSWIMGTFYDDRIDLWGVDPDLLGNYKDEIAVFLAWLGARRDDHGGDPARATPLLVTNSGPNTRTLSHAQPGVISMNTDSWPTSCGPWGDPGCIAQRTPWEDEDFFHFQARTGSTFVAKVDTLEQMTSFAYAANLRPDLALWRRQSTQSNAPWELVVEEATNVRPDGAMQITYEPEHIEYREYAIAVRSRGGYGILGQYKLQVTGTHVMPGN